MGLAWRWRQGVVALVLAVGLASAERRAEGYGDALQVALPVAALACAVAGGGAGELVVRYVGTLVVVHGAKNGLGRAPINIRPSGGHRGIPSGHTASAAFGASALVHGCLQAPAMRAAAVLGAGFVGASRVDAGAHDALQVLAGAGVGVLGERMARRARTRRRIGRALRLALARLRGGVEASGAALWRRRVAVAPPRRS